MLLVEIESSNVIVWGGVTAKLSLGNFSFTLMKSRSYLNQALKISALF